jgi:endonuclease YncB( thermonuclease family)
MRRLLPLVLALAPLHAAAAGKLAGTVVSVADGDSLVVVDKDAKRHRVRLAEIDAPERRQPFGAEARKSLAGLCLRKPASVEVSETDSHQRAIGKVKCGEVDANAEQVRRGMAWVTVRNTMPNSPLPEMEANARLRGLGLWAGDKPEPPWEWRKRQAPPAKK